SGTARVPATANREYGTLVLSYYANWNLHLLINQLCMNTDLIGRLRSAAMMKGCAFGGVLSATKALASHAATLAATATARRELQPHVGRLRNATLDCTQRRRALRHWQAE